MSAVACHFLRFTVQLVGQAICAIVANWNFEEKSEMKINRNCHKFCFWTTVDVGCRSQSPTSESLSTEPAGSPLPFEFGSSICSSHSSLSLRAQQKRTSLSTQYHRFIEICLARVLLARPSQRSIPEAGALLVCPRRAVDFAWDQSFGFSPPSLSPFFCTCVSRRGVLCTVRHAARFSIRRRRSRRASPSAAAVRRPKRRSAMATRRTKKKTKQTTPRTANRRPRPAKARSPPPHRSSDLPPAPMAAARNANPSKLSRMQRHHSRPRQQ
jgi:hypothetical protein